MATFSLPSRPPGYAERPSRYAAVALVAANVVPLVGVLYFGWNLYLLLALFWWENGIIGLFNVARMALAKRNALRDGATGRLAGKLSTIGFFIIHYGFFWLGHGFFLLVVFGASNVAEGVLTDMRGFYASLLALLVSHGISFWRNYILRREYETQELGAQLFAPYGRVVILHLTILGGAYLIEQYGSDVYALGLLVGLKLLLDLGLHLFAHRRLLAA